VILSNLLRSRWFQVWILHILWLLRLPRVKIVSDGGRFFVLQGQENERSAGKCDPRSDERAGQNDGREGEK